MLAGLTALNVLTRGQAPLFTKYPTAAAQVLDRTLTVDRLGDFSPGYLLFVTAARAVALSQPAIIVVQLLMLGGAALLVGLAARRSGGWIAACTAGALVLLARPAVTNASELEPEGLLLLLIAGALWCLVDEQLSARRVIAGGVLLGLAAGVRPTALLAALAVAVFLALTSRRLAGLFGVGVVPPLVGILGSLMLLTGTLSLMDPGAVFLEGNGPLATGYTGVQPQIVNDVAALEAVPDAIHLSYRSVASRDQGRALDRDQANAFWRGRAMNFVRRHPGAAAGRLVRKLWFAVHDYDSWDTPALEVRGAALHVWYRPGFGVLVPLALGGLLLWRSRPRWLVLLFAAAWLAAPVLMYVSGRQRNPLVPVLALLGGVAVARLARDWGESWKRGLAPTLAVVAAAIALTQEYHWQLEDRLSWQAITRARQLTAAVASAGPEQKEALLAESSTWNSGYEPWVPAAALRRAAVSALARFEDAPTQFDAALALLRAGDDANAELVFAALGAGGYRPERGARATSSLAYYHAIALWRVGRRPEASAALGVARSEAPGDANVLAATAVLAELEGRAEDAHAAREELQALYDRFTAALAQASAERSLRTDGRWRATAASLHEAFPEWSRPGDVLHE